MTPSNDALGIEADVSEIRWEPTVPGYHLPTHHRPERQGDIWTGSCHIFQVAENPSSDFFLLNLSCLLKNASHPTQATTFLA